MDFIGYQISQDKRKKILNIKSDCEYQPRTRRELSSNHSESKFYIINLMENAQNL